MAISLVIGALQAYRVRAGWITNYGADVFGTAWIYAIARSGRTIFQRGRVVNPVATAAIVFLLCAASEFGQRWHLVPGHFDPYDLLAYAGAVVGCVVAERAFGPFVIRGPEPTTSSAIAAENRSLR